ncbi:type II secretion system, component PulF [Rubidibacter lacunae KORDI 51-2]|uniref:Type II secretion system, component PulF n=1 Tax=Rubidibacter lacunae KORDI 51-2 TaxID=582515 RepID=U5D7Y1_9CHRO|nr:type II secretion system F family protein [Rubidibacter lacunae]ERN40728.1 type II secretion system, component PulF [Rubidibacter lacunae KORDI 51-2]
MPTFVVDVLDASGKRLKEKVVAPSPAQAQRMLLSKYARVGQAKRASINMNLDLSAIEERLSGVGVKDKAIFSRQFSALVDAGVGITRGLAVLGEQTRNPKLRKSIAAIDRDVQQGINLSEAMGKQPQCFDRLYVSMIEAGETGGVLDEVLDRLAKLLEDLARLQGQIKAAMAYPVAVMLFAVAVFFGMAIFLIPIFGEIFEDLGVELPLITRLMLQVSDVLRSWRAALVVGVAIAIVLLIRQYYKTPAGRLQIDMLLLKIPVLGDLNQKSAVARFCRVFGTLTRSGVPILTSLEIVKDTSGNQVVANSIEATSREVEKGGMISTALIRERVFPPLATAMISIGEETGEVDAMLMKVAEFYEQEVEQAVKALTSILEPVMIVVVACLVGVILVSMYMPMFKVFDAIG